MDRDSTEYLLEKEDSPHQTNKRNITNNKFLWIVLPNIALLCVQLILIGWYVHGIIATNTPRIEMAYGANTSYMSLDHKYDHLWGGQIVEEAGIITLKEHGGKYHDIENGAISMFHQLHCLASLRKALQDGREGRYVALDWHMSRHWPHCLWYLRQSIMCQANGYIEHETERDDIKGFIDGSNDVRQCKDPAPLYKLFEEKRASKLVDILS